MGSSPRVSLQVCHVKHVRKGCDKKNIYIHGVCVCGYYAAVNEHGTEKRQHEGMVVSFHLQGVFLQTKFSRKQVSSDVYKNIIRAEQKGKNLIIFHKNI